MKLSQWSARLLGLLFIPLFMVSCISTRPSISSVPMPTFVSTPTFELSTIVTKTNEVYSSAYTYANPGHYTVAYIKTVVQDGDVTITTYIWYPAQANGKPDTKEGPFPLVVFSPGAAIDGVDYYILLRHLASYGFVVTSWLPRNEVAYSQSFAVDWSDETYRPLDMKRIMDDLEKMNAPGGELAGLIDMKRTAVAGHSLGGATALFGGGAQFNYDWCTAHADLINKDNESTCSGEFLSHQPEIATILGLKSVPKGLWPPMGDRRVVAIISMAPVGKMWGAEYEGVASVKVPALIMTGSEDSDILPDLGAIPIYEHLGSPQKTLVIFEDKDHSYFIPSLPPGLDSCDALFHITTAFLLAELKGDAEAAKALSPANMNLPDVKYETTEFNSH